MASVLSAFCGGLQTVLGHEASRNNGLEIPDALKLLERLALKGKTITRDTIFCQKSITAKIVERGGDDVFSVKDNQKTLRQDIKTAFNEPAFPLCSWNRGLKKVHGSIKWRAIDVLPAEAAGIEDEWPTVRQICRVIRSRQVKKNGEWETSQHEVVYLVSSLHAAARHKLCWASIARSSVDRDHASKQGRDPWRGWLYESLRQRSSKHFLPNQLHSQNPEIRRTVS